MDEAYIDPTKPRKKTGITNKHHFQVDCFNEILDWLLQKLDSRFNETSSQLLVCSAAFNPRDSFNDFNVDSLISLAKLYPNDFDHVELRDLNAELFLYIDDVRGDDKFANINTIVELSQKMVATRKHLTYSMVYRLLKLVLVLPVTTATVERIFSAMKTVKTKLRNRIEMAADRVRCGYPRVSGFRVSGLVLVFRPRFSGSGSGSVSGSVSGFDFHPWISNGYPK